MKLNKLDLSVMQVCLSENLLFTSDKLIHSTRDESTLGKQAPVEFAASQIHFTVKSHKFSTSTHQSLRPKKNLFITHQLQLDKRCAAEALATAAKKPLMGRLVTQRCIFSLTSFFMTNRSSCIILLEASNRYGSFSVEFLRSKLDFLSITQADTLRSPAKPKY